MSGKILDTFEGKWLGFLLWNKEITDFSVIWNDFRPEANESEEEKKLSKSRYDYMSDLISSTEFKSCCFREIMSDWFFHGKYSSQPIVFEWQRRTPSTQTQKSLTNGKTYQKVDFSRLNNLEDLIPKMDNIVKQIVKSLEENRKLPYDIVLQKVDKIANEVIRNSQGKSLLIETITDIMKFLNNKNITSTVTDDDILHLCRTLTWNRLFDDKWQFIYYIPALLVDKTPLGGVVFAGTRALEPHEFLIIGQIINRILGSFHFIFHENEIKNIKKRSKNIRDVLPLPLSFLGICPTTSVAM